MLLSKSFNLAVTLSTHSHKKVKKINGQWTDHTTNSVAAPFNTLPRNPLFQEQLKLQQQWNRYSGNIMA
jgi:hypothetical protein